VPLSFFLPLLSIDSFSRSKIYFSVIKDGFFLPFGLPLYSTQYSERRSISFDFPDLCASPPPNLLQQDSLRPPRPRICLLFLFPPPDSLNPSPCSSAPRFRNYNKHHFSVFEFSVRHSLPLRVMGLSTTDRSFFKNGLCTPPPLKQRGSISQVESEFYFLLGTLPLGIKFFV